MKNGVPFDLALQLDDETRAGFAIIFGEFSGAGEFDFDIMEFAQQEPS